MPQPSHLSTQEGRLTLSSSFAVVTDHYRDARLDAAIARSLDRIETQTGHFNSNISVGRRSYPER